MIVDFQHHYTPRELMSGAPGDGRIVHFDASGAPAHTQHALLWDLDEHIAMMDEAGIDLAVLTSSAGMGAVEADKARFINDRIRQAELDYPGRFKGAAHVNPFAGSQAFRELARARHELGFAGVVITSEMAGHTIDAEELEPFWREAAALGMYVFVHPALKLNHPAPFDSDDLARSVGREFSLVEAVIRLINSGVFDRHPALTVHMAHLGGGIASLMGRVRSYQDKVFWGTDASPRHGRLPQKDFDHYLRQNMVFDTAGFCGEVNAVKMAALEIPIDRIVFATDYPQEIRTRTAVADFVIDIGGLGTDGDRILSGNVSLLIPQEVGLAGDAR